MSEAELRNAHPPNPGIRTFRYGTAPTLEDSAAMSYENIPEGVRGQLAASLGQEHGDGAESRTLFQGGGMSLVQVWFKSNYPLARHSHDSDCLYYILAGSLTLGGESFGPGDGFLVPAETPYTYTAGPGGLELLEFRSSETFDIKIPGTGEAYWKRLREKMVEAHSNWHGEERPSSG